MRRATTALSALLAASAAALFSGDADACGGCFLPPTASTVVTGHRMALAVSPTQTVLWDQIQYAGDPKEFAWVLPVKPGAYIEASTDAWFEVLDAATNVQITQPPVGCHEKFNFGCGSAANDIAPTAAGFGEDAPGNAGGPPVNVVHRGSVGPYETVTLETKVPGALNDWLTMAGYSVDPSSQPTIDEYIKEGFDFIALKLKPDAGVSEMKPVRVVSPGASPTLPLRMVAVGTGPEVALTLFLIGEGRWETANFPNVSVPVDLLSWDFADSSSNYGELRKQTLAASEGGRGWITPYARSGAMLTPVFNPITFFNVFYGFDPNGQPLDTIAKAYLDQGILNKEAATEAQPMIDEEGCRIAFESFPADSAAIVKNPCPMGVPPNDPLCGDVIVGEIDSRTIACGALDDVAAALVGSHPSDVWLTRIEAVLPRSALKTDLTLKPADGQDEVQNWVQARVAVNAEVVCGSFVPPVVWSGARSGGLGANLATMSLAALSLLGVLVRRRMRRASISS